MIDLHIEFDKNKYSDIMKKCSLLASEAEINKAISRGAEKAADEAKKETVKQLLSEYTLSGSEIKSPIKTRKMGGSEVGAVMNISSGVFPLYNFDGVTPREVMPPARGPVQVKVKKGGGATFKQSFVAKMKSGHVGVYEREEEKRRDKIRVKGKDSNKEYMHINEFFGPSIAGMFGREKETEINIAAREKAMETLDKYVINELERLLNG
jgi:hypothetical protein